MPLPLRNLLDRAVKGLSTSRGPLARRDLYWSAGLMAFVGAMLVYSLGLGSFSWSVPYFYGSDALQYLAVFRNILTTGWYTETSLLGAPFGTTHFDNPVPDGLFLLFVAALRPFTSNPAIPFNLIWIGGFFLVALSFFAAARMLGVPRALAAAGALAYTFLPFHFLRLTHLFYTVYFLPPLVVAVAILLGEENLAAVRAWLTWRKVLLFLATGAAGIYNAFFLCLVLGFAAVAAAIATRERRRLAHGAAAIALIAASALANLLPNVIYQARAGKNPEVAQRNVGESEVYGLKMAQLVLPSAGHHIPAMGEQTRKYGALTFVTENHSSTLGLIGTAGFLLCLFHLLFLRAPAGDVAGARVDRLAQVNAFVFLVATVGGFGTLFALLVSPQLRALNRASVVIAAVALLALLIFIGRWAAAASSTAIAQRRVGVAAGVLFLVWAVDQAPQRIVQLPEFRLEHAADADFVSRIAAVVPPGSMILQVPYTMYPEAPPRHQEGHYGLFRPYLHDSTLRWSFGAIRGRESDLWLRALSARPIPEQVEIAARKGFVGIYVERRAYTPDVGADVERQLAAILGRPAVERSDGKASFYRLTPASGPAQSLLPPVELGDGFHPWERDGFSVWAWSRGDATLVLTNPGREPIAAVLRLKVGTIVPRTVRVPLPGREPLAIELLGGQVKVVEERITLPPGQTRVLLSSPQPALLPGTGDQRKLGFEIRDPRIDEAKPAP